MHGWAGSGAYYDEMLKHLGLTGLRAITVDLRGHGGSDKILSLFVAYAPKNDSCCKPSSERRPCPFACTSGTGSSPTPPVATLPLRLPIAWGATLIPCTCGFIGSTPRGSRRSSGPPIPTGGSRY